MVEEDQIADFLSNVLTNKIDKRIIELMSLDSDNDRIIETLLSEMEGK